MKYTLNKLLALAGDLVLENTITSDVNYDWLDIIGLPQRPAELTNNLFFVSESDGSSPWYPAYDRNVFVENIESEKGWHFVFEKEKPTSINVSNYIVVSSFIAFIDCIYKDARSRTTPHIIGVTGSVGKTTTVALLEHLLQTAGKNTVRFWSKRITPLSLYCHYINRVDVETEFVVLEYSAYFSNDIGALSSILPPDLAFFINLCPMHINPHGFSSLDEIFQTKSLIKHASTDAFINESVLNITSNALPKGWNVFHPSTSLASLTTALPPTLRTAEMLAVTELVAVHYRLNMGHVTKALATFTPKERRIPIVKFKNSKLFFDGEVSVGGRIWSWFETIDDSIPVLLVDHIFWGDEDPKGFYDLLNKIYSSPNTYVLDNPHNRNILPVSANYLSEEDFRNTLLTNLGSYVVYHKAMSTRDPNFIPESYLVDRWN